MQAPEGYVFSSDWFSRHIPIWTQILAHFSRPQGWQVLEVGAYEGRATVWLCENLIKDTGAIWCIDSFDDSAGGPLEDTKGLYDRFMRNISQLGNKDRVHVMRGWSHEQMYELMSRGFRSRFDFVYIDGSHKTADVLRDAVIAFDLLKAGGLMIFDDYLWPLEQQGQKNPLNSPKMAIDVFTDCYSNKISIIQNVPLYQLALMKVQD